jgi:hypothetical protein
MKGAHFVNAETENRLTELGEADWFQMVGHPVDDPRVVVVSSWKEAEKVIGRWDTVALEAVNRFRVRLDAIAKPRFQQWNTIINSLRPTVKKLVKGKFRRIVKDNHLPKNFEETATRNILLACAESEFADVVPVGFFSDTASWYLRGHIPCAWKGKFPDGGLIVY